MQKIYFSLLVALVLGACATQPAETPATNSATVEENTETGTKATTEKAGSESAIKWQDSSVVAVAYIGYDKDIAAIKTSEQFKKLAERLPQLNDIDHIAVDAPGEELYLVIPRHKNANVTVYEYTFEMATKEKPEKSGLVYYQKETGDPIIVKGNISDICPNMQIELKSGNGETYTFSPSLSLENGKLYVTKGMQELE